MAEAENLSHTVGIDQIIDIDSSTHAVSLHMLTLVTGMVYYRRHRKGPGGAVTPRGQDETYEGGPAMTQVTSASPLTIDDLDSRITLTVEEVASLLGLGRTAAYEAARRGDIPTRKLGRRVLVPVPAFQAWLGISGDNGSR